MNLSYYQFWAKTDRQDPVKTYHLLPYHCLDVAAVAAALLERDTRWRAKLCHQLLLDDAQLQRWIVLPLAWHDIGKFSPTFQHLVPLLSQKLSGRTQAYSYSARHDLLGSIFWKKQLSKLARSHDWLALESSDKLDLIEAHKTWLQGIWGHHGRPVDHASCSTTYNHLFDPGSTQAALDFASACEDLLTPTPAPILWTSTLLDQFKRMSWVLAGFYVLCDWVGSDSKCFTFETREIPLADYWPRALQLAHEAIEKKGIVPPQARTWSGFSGLLPHLKDASPSPLQQWASKLGQQDQLHAGPHLFIAEDETGSGKTEAALLLAHALMSKGLADGIYIGLPTMATANAMFARQSESYQHLFEPNTSPSLALAHGMAKQHEGFQKIKIDEYPPTQAGHQYGHNTQDQAGEATCIAWLADDRRRAMLADVGVGTIDQALLGVLSSKYQSLRLFGLGRKVLILDEIHAYDTYTSELVCNLLRFHAAQGGSVILLSATLHHALRQQLIEAFEDGAAQARGADPRQEIKLKSDDYPLLTWTHGGQLEEHPIAPAKPEPKTYGVDFLNTAQDVINQAVAWLEPRDRCVCWIRNTVREATEAANTLRALLGAEHVTLFHARFTQLDRQRVEAEILARFGKDSKPEQRHGHIVIATQVIEQSLDLDFDEMIVDLAPIDLVLQRLGRWRRHTRTAHGELLKQGKDQRAPTKPIILAPPWTDEPDTSWSKELFPHSRFIYPHVEHLWFTQRALRQYADKLTIPDDTRALMASVYEDDQPPAGLQDLSDRASNDQNASQVMAHLNRLEFSAGYQYEGKNWQPEQRAVTRLGDNTTTLRLVCEDKHGHLQPLGYHHHRYKHFDAPWERSQVNILAFYVTAQALPSNPKQLSDATARMLDQGQYCVTVIMHPTQENTWQGQALRGPEHDRQPVTIRYSTTHGLEILNDEQGA